jgi:drug/metabolite transporter (DMT)-like permease
MNTVETILAVVGVVFVALAAFAFNWALWAAAIEQIRSVRRIPREARRGAVIRGSIFALLTLVGLGLIIVEPFGEQHTAELLIGGLGLLVLLGVNGTVIWLLWHYRRQQ